jgi:hypothetical protein
LPRLQHQRRRRELHRLGIDVEAVEVALEDRLDDLAVAPDLAPVPRLLLVEREQQITRDHQEVPRAAGRIEEREVADAGRRAGHRVVGQGLRHPVLPALLEPGLDRHQRVEGDLAGLAPGAPGDAPRLQPVEHPRGLGLRVPAVLLAHRQPHLAERVLQQPLDHVALGEHLRLRRDLVVLELLGGGELGVEALALGVVPVLVDPPERGVVGPHRRQLGSLSASITARKVAAGTGTSDVIRTGP